jgi:DNA invertase Pin-like site-specific DNA recombinase
MNRQPEQGKITALYERLSIEDSKDTESNSIKNQKAMLAEFAERNGFDNIRHFADDGTTGLRFERDAWKQLIAEVEAGNVARIVMKDMTRFGRDHVQVGNYLEMFRRRGVRFIAVAHGIDSLNPDTLEFAPFINIMSEWYSRDNSRKLKNAFRAKGMRGEHTTNKAIYGFLKDPDDKDKWVVDGEAATVIRRIFRMTTEGMGPGRIAAALRADGVDRPSYHMARLGVGDHQWGDERHRHEWSPSSVSKIVSRPEYAGHTVNLRTEKGHFKDKKTTWKPKEEWLVFENTHEAIVEQATWDAAQKCRTVKRRTDTFGEANPLTGILHCADCGRRMYNHRTNPYETTNAGTGRQRGMKSRDIYVCSLYQIHRGDCTMHYITAGHASELILDAVRGAVAHALSDGEGFTEAVRAASALRQGEAAKSHGKQIARNERRIAELDTLFRKTYEDYAAGRLGEKRFAQLSGGYEAEQETLERQTAELKAELDEFDRDSGRADGFIELAKRYAEIPELTAPILHEFVEKVVVHEAVKTDGGREQEVEIHLNHIGRYTPPKSDDGDGDCGGDGKRAKWREYKRKERAKKQPAETGTAKG